MLTLIIKDYLHRTTYSMLAEADALVSPLLAEHVYVPMSSQELLSIVYTRCVLFTTYETVSPSFVSEVLVKNGLEAKHIKIAGLNSSLVTAPPIVSSSYISNEVITISSSSTINRNKISSF